MGRKRRKIIRRRVVKPPPKVFLCPICNQEAVTVYHEEGAEYARVSCANCKASAEVKWYPAYTAVDTYAEFYDIVTGAKKPVEVVASESGESSEVSGEAGEPQGQESASQPETSGDAGEGMGDVSEDRED